MLCSRESRQEKTGVDDDQTVAGKIPARMQSSGKNSPEKITKNPQ
jgi:hypothetical protein